MWSLGIARELAVTALVVGTALATAEGVASQQAPATPPRTGVLMMAPGDPEGTVAYAKPFDAVFQAALQVAAAQWDVEERDAERGLLKAAIGKPGPDGRRLAVSVALSKLPDGRIQVVVSPAGGDYPTSASATRTYVAALTSAVAGKPVRVRACVFTDETQPASLRNRRESVKDLAEEIGSLPIDVVKVPEKDSAKLWLEVVRTSDSEGLTVKLTVPGTEYETEWTRSSPTDAGAAEEVAQVFKAWLAANRDYLLTRRAERPVPVGQCAMPEQAAAAASAAGAERVRLYLGPAPAPLGFINVNPDFAASYADLCAAYKKTPTFSSALTLVAHRDDADLVLELTYRGEPMFSHDALEELRATLFVAGPGTRIALNGRTGIVKQGESSQSAWPVQAARLLQQTLDWVNANRAVIEQARTARVTKPPER